MSKTLMSGLPVNGYSKDVQDLFATKPPITVKIAAGLFILIMFCLYGVCETITFPEQLSTSGNVIINNSGQSQILNVTIPQKYVNSLNSATKITLTVYILSGIQMTIFNPHFIGFSKSSLDNGRYIAKFEFPLQNFLESNIKITPGENMILTVRLAFSVPYYSKIFQNNKTNNH